MELVSKGVILSSRTDPWHLLLILTPREAVLTAAVA
jgi:hypothetical protein